MVRKLLKLSSLIVIAVLLVMLTGCPLKVVLQNIVSVEDLDPISVEFGTPFDEIPLPETVEVTLDNEETRMLVVTWNEGDYDGEAAGTYTLEGVLSLPEGVANPDGLKAEIDVTVEEEVVVPLVVVAVEDLGPMTVPFGTAFEDLDLPETVEVTLDDDSVEDVDVEWAEGDYDGNTAGTYTLYGTLDLPEGIENPDNLMAEIDVTVEEEEVEPEAPVIVAITVEPTPVCGGGEFDVEAEVENADVVTFWFEGEDVEGALVNGRYVATFTAPDEPGDYTVTVQAENEDYPDVVEDTKEFTVIEDTGLKPDIRVFKLDEIECGDTSTKITAEIFHGQLDLGSIDWKLTVKDLNPLQDEDFAPSSEINEPKLVTQQVIAGGYKLEFLWEFEGVDCLGVDLEFSIADVCGNLATTTAAATRIDNVEPTFWHDYDPDQDPCYATGTVINWTIWENCLEDFDFEMCCDSVLVDWAVTSSGFDEAVGRYFKSGTVELEFTEDDFVDCSTYRLHALYEDCHGPDSTTIDIWKDLLDPRIRIHGFYRVGFHTPHLAGLVSSILAVFDVAYEEFIGGDHPPIDLNNLDLAGHIFGDEIAEALMFIQPECDAKRAYYFFIVEDECLDEVVLSYEGICDPEKANVVKAEIGPGVWAGFHRVDTCKIDCDEVSGTVTVYDTCRNSSSETSTIIVDNVPPSVTLDWDEPDCDDPEWKLTLTITDGSYTEACTDTTKQLFVDAINELWDYSDNIALMTVGTGDITWLGSSTYKIETSWSLIPTECTEQATISMLLPDNCKPCVICPDWEYSDQPCPVNWWNEFDIGEGNDPFEFTIYLDAPPEIDKFELVSMEGYIATVGWVIYEECGISELCVEYLVTDICDDATFTVQEICITDPATKGTLDLPIPKNCVTVDATLTVWNFCNQWDDDTITFKFDTIPPEFDLVVKYNNTVWAGETIPASPCNTVITLQGTITEECCLPGGEAWDLALLDKLEDQWEAGVAAAHNGRESDFQLLEFFHNTSWDGFCTYEASFTLMFKFIDDPTPDATSYTFTFFVDDCVGNESEKYTITFEIEQVPPDPGPQVTSSYVSYNSNRLRLYFDDDVSLNGEDIELYLFSAGAWSLVGVADGTGDSVIVNIADDVADNDIWRITFESLLDGALDIEADTRYKWVVKAGSFGLLEDYENEDWAVETIASDDLDPR